MSQGNDGTDTQQQIASSANAPPKQPQQPIVKTANGEAAPPKPQNLTQQSSSRRANASEVENSQISATHSAAPRTTPQQNSGTDQQSPQHQLQNTAPRPANKPVASAQNTAPSPHQSQAPTQQKPAETIPQVSAADKSSQVQEAAANKEKAERKTMPLGQKLLTKGLISKDQLETALKEQRGIKGKKKMIGAIMVEMGFISEAALAEMLTESSGVKVFDLKRAVLDSRLIKQVPQNVAMRIKAVPVAVEDGAIKVAITDIYNVIAIDQLRQYFPANLKIVPVYSSESDILEIVDQYYGYETSIGGILKEIETGISEKKTFNGEEEGYTNPTVRLVDAILIDAIKRGASDIHFEPEESFLRLRYRIDGKLMQIRSFHKSYWPAVVVRIKIMSGMNIAETRNPQDGRLSYYVLGRDVDFRVATHPTVFGENIVMRILDKQKALMPIDKLELSTHNEKMLYKLLKRPEGIMIVTGPTGSGKTTTLYSILNFINAIDINVMTLENPVEYQLPMLRQSDVREDKGMDFVAGIKSLMRQDPDVIFVGEVRDEPTANMAMRAAMTGHKVFTTLHTNDAAGAIPRLVDIGIPPHLLAGSMICAIAQRLARRLCNVCKEEYEPSNEEKRLLGVDGKQLKIYHNKGCDKCYNSGYKGRIAIHEILPVDKGMDDLIATGATRKQLIEYSMQQGFVPIAQDGIDKVLAGLTDIEELIRVIDLTERM